MEWLTDLAGVGAGVGASVASGGLFGLIGSLFGAGFKVFERREARREKQSERAHELALHRLNMEAAAQETESEIKLAQTAGSYAGLTASIDADAALTGNVSRWVNDARAMFRPVLTIISLVLLTLVFIRVTDDAAITWFAQEVDHRAALIAYVVNSIAFTATLSVTWWFGDRSLTPPALKHL